MSATDDELAEERARLREKALTTIRVLKRTLGRVEKCLVESKLFPVYLWDAHEGVIDLVVLNAKDTALQGLQLIRMGKRARKKR